MHPALSETHHIWSNKSRISSFCSVAAGTGTLCLWGELLKSESTESGDDWLLCPAVSPAAELFLTGAGARIKRAMLLCPLPSTATIPARDTLGATWAVRRLESTLSTRFSYTNNN
jgi:hypothetical protein